MIKTRRKSTGFTLIELVISMTIIAILSIAYSRVRSTTFQEKQALYTSGSAIEAELMYARDRAIQTQLFHRLVFTPGTDDYSMYAQSPTADAWILLKTNTADLPHINVDTTSLADNQVIFGKDGVAYEDSQADPPSLIGATITATENITLIHNGGTQSKIYIQSETGYVVQE